MLSAGDKNAVLNSIFRTTIRFKFPVKNEEEKKSAFFEPTYDSKINRTKLRSHNSDVMIV